MQVSRKTVSKLPIMIVYFIVFLFYIFHFDIIYKICILYTCINSLFLQKGKNIKFNGPLLEMFWRIRFLR